MSATREKSAFRQAVQISADIRATPEVIWARLTDAAGFPLWNSTVQSIDGPIEPGRKLAIRVPAAPGRTFRPTVVSFFPPRGMTWREGSLPMFQGVRTFTVDPLDSGASRFTMREELRGAMLPMIARSLPDFVPVSTATPRISATRVKAESSRPAGQLRFCVDHSTARGVLSDAFSHAQAASRSGLSHIPGLRDNNLVIVAVGSGRPAAHMGRSPRRGAVPTKCPQLNRIEADPDGSRADPISPETA